MPGPEYVGMHTPYARSDAGTAGGVARELATIGSNANSVAAGVGLTTNGEALFRAANDLSRIGGTVNGRANLADGFAILPTGPIGGNSGLVFTDDFQPIPPPDGELNAPLRTLVQYLDGTTITTTTGSVTIDWPLGDRDQSTTAQIYVETHEIPGQPTYAIVGASIDHLGEINPAAIPFPPLKAALVGFDKAGGDVNLIGEYGWFNKYELPPDTPLDELSTSVLADVERQFSEWSVAGHDPNSIPLTSYGAIPDVGSFVSSGSRLGGGGGLSMDLDDLYEEFPEQALIEAYAPTVEAAADVQLAYEHEEFADGSERATTEYSLNGGGEFSALFTGAAEVGVVGRQTTLETGGVTYEETSTTFYEGHTGAGGIELGLAVPTFYGKYFQSQSGNDLGAHTFATTCDSDEIPRTCVVSSVAVTGSSANSGVELGVVPIDVSATIEKTTEQVTAELKRPQVVYEDTGWGDHYDLPPYEPPVYDKYAPQPIEPAGNNDVYLPIVGAGGSESEPSEIYLPIVGAGGSESEPSEIYLPIVGASGPAPTPEPNLIQDMPPLERERLYLQEPELIYNPGQERETYIVEEGDNFWYMAEEMTALANGGEPVSDAEFQEYWNELQELNYDNLRVEGNPDLIWEGQEMTLPGETSEPSWHVKPQ